MEWLVLAIAFFEFNNIISHTQFVVVSNELYNALTVDSPWYSIYLGCGPPF